MPRPRSEKVEEIKAKLITRLRDGFYRSGDRFLSNRAVAQKFGISYQTAHRLVSELCSERWLERRPASGTYIPGGKAGCKGVQLIFSPRCKRRESFGARLLAVLILRLQRERIPVSVTFAENRKVKINAELFPVIWESARAAEECAKHEHSALLLTDHPPSGMQAVYIDSVSTDDFSGGVCAAQILQQKSGARQGFAILSGPSDDERSNCRVEGFRSVLRASVIPAGGWYFEDGYRAAGDALRRGPRGIFCCNDRLAEAVIAYCERRKIERPPLVGFDDAPVAEKLNLTTIAIPWDELVGAAIEVIKRRLNGDRATSSHQTFMPRPIIRR